MIYFYFFIVFILFLCLKKGEKYKNKNHNQNNILEIVDENYFKKMNNKDFIARKTDSKNIVPLYRKNIRRLDSSERIKITNLFLEINKLIRGNRKTKLMLKVPFRVYMFDGIENNFPHTHNNSILIPVNFELTDTYDTLNTLLHEKIHIIQRFRKDNFYDLYENYWNFIKTEIPNLSIVEKISRTNPDGTDNNWVYSKNGINIVLLSLYNDDFKNISDVRTYGVYLDSSYRVITPIKKKEINSIEQFTDFFGFLNGNNYHPNEISADMIAGYLIESNSMLQKSDAFLQMEQWYSNLQ